MNFQRIFEEYYTQFRGDSDIPLTTDPEWAIAVRYGNTALRRLQEVDGEDWEWLWTTAVADGESYTWTGNAAGPVVLSFDCPANMVRPGGWIRFTDPVSGAFFMVDVIPAYNVQRMAGSAPYAYFTGSSNTGFTLHISLTGTSYQNYKIDFPYYRSITLFNATPGANGGVTEDGNTITECPDANYLINSILAARFRSTRNYPSYQTAKAEADEALINMQTKNRKGVDGHPFNLVDSSSGSFGL